MEVTTVGLDMAKNVFQVHAITAAGEVVVRRSLRRAQVIPFFSMCIGVYSRAERPSAAIVRSAA